MTTYTEYGNNVFVNNHFGEELDNLKPAIYTVSVDIMGNYFLTKSNKFSIPDRLYGETRERADHVISTFYRRSANNSNTGVLLSGTKGSGKTMLAKLISNMLIDKGISTIVVSECYYDAKFIDFVNGIKDRAVFMFDEFDKTYDEREKQESLLTLLDGTGITGKMFILTKNDGYISNYFMNRPSRIFYNFNYDKISTVTMYDYLETKLTNKDHIKNFERLYDVSNELSFDVIQGLVEELNAYPEMSFTTCIDMMGITFSDKGAWSVSSININGVELKNVNSFNLYGFEPSTFFNNKRNFEILINPSNDKEKKALDNSAIVSKECDGYFINLSYDIGNVDMSDGNKIIISGKDENFKIVMSCKEYTYGFSHLF